MGIIYVTNAMVWIATLFLTILALRQQTIDPVGDSDTPSSELNEDSERIKKEDVL